MNNKFSDKLKYIKEQFPGSYVNPTIEQVKDLQMVVYLLIVDNEMSIIGHASGFNRFKLIFPGQAAPAHQKGFTAAISTLTAKKSVERVIIPMSSKKYVKAAEAELIKLFSFHKEKLKIKSLKLFHARLNDLNIPLADISPLHMALLQPLLNPAGSELGNFKKAWMEYYDIIDPSFRPFVNKLFGKYYTDI
jgi:hypothetical protein